MKRKIIVLRKLISFGLVALMLFHMFLCVMSDRRWQFGSENQYNTIWISINYAIPLLIICGLTTFIALSKNHSAIRIVILIKFFISCLMSFWIWLVMLFAYHNPTNSEWVFINCSTLFMVLFAVLFLMLERNIIKRMKSDAIEQ